MMMDVHFQFSHTDLRVVERNETHATLWCETDLQQIIFKITKNGKTRWFEAKRYERIGSFVIAETSILVNETVNATCIVKTQSRNETDRPTLHPYESLWSLNTILTHCWACTIICTWRKWVSSSEVYSVCALLTEFLNEALHAICMYLDPTGPSSCEEKGLVSQVQILGLVEVLYLLV